MIARLNIMRTLRIAAASLPPATFSDDRDLIFIDDASILSGDAATFQNYRDHASPAGIDATTTTTAANALANFTGAQGQYGLAFTLLADAFTRYAMMMC